jgi:hypothetical protein
MHRNALQVLTWGTISAALVSALLLAILGEERDLWHSEREAEVSVEARPHGATLPVVVPHANPAGARPTDGAGPTAAGRQ